MSNGPIDYLSESASQRTPPTEFGGYAGLIQPAPHDLAAAEAHGVLIRAGMRGDTSDADTIVDPDTGRTLPVDQNRKVGSQ